MLGYVNACRSRPIATRGPEDSVESREQELLIFKTPPQVRPSPTNKSPPRIKPLRMAMCQILLNNPSTLTYSITVLWQADWALMVRTLKMRILNIGALTMMSMSWDPTWSLRSDRVTIHWRLRESDPPIIRPCCQRRRTCVKDPSFPRGFSRYRSNADI